MKKFKKGDKVKIKDDPNLYYLDDGKESIGKEGVVKLIGKGNEIFCTIEFNKPLTNGIEKLILPSYYLELIENDHQGMIQNPLTGEWGWL